MNCMMSENRYRYHINIFYSVEDQAFIADIPDLKYCSAHGDTPQEALAEVLIALESVIEMFEEDGRPLPEVKYRPDYIAQLLNKFPKG